MPQPRNDRADPRSRAERLRDVALAQSGRPKQEDIAAFAHELHGGELVDLGPVGLWVEPPVEVVQRLKVGDGYRDTLQSVIEEAYDRAIAEHT